MPQNRLRRLAQGYAGALTTYVTPVETAERAEGQLTTSTLGRLNRFRLSVLTLCAVFAVGLGCTSVAAAAPPSREPVDLPTEPFALTDTEKNSPCSFPVSLQVITNKEVKTTFVRRGGVTVTSTTGSLKVRFINTATVPNKTIDRNISGPIFTTTNSDGSTSQKTAGLGLWVFDPGVAPEFPSRLVITSGKTESIIGPEEGAFRFISRHGSFEDICAALAP